MNEEAVTRIRPNLQKGEDPIRRVFIIEEGIKTEELCDLKQLMNELNRVGVVIKYIGLKYAQRLAAAHPDSPIVKLEDFTVFDTEHEDLKYAGRFQDIYADSKRVIISSDPQIIESLTRQFQELWKQSVGFEEGVEPSRLLES